MFADLILSAVLLVIGSAVLISTSHYPDFSQLSVIGPGFFPNIISIFFIISAVYLILKTLYKAFVKKTDSEGNSYIEMEKSRVSASIDKNFKQNRRSVLNLVITMVMILLYGLLLPTVGYEILTIVFLFVSMLLNGVRKPVTLIVVPIVATVVVYLLFVLILKVQLPRLLF